ncbi:hypothetical protein FB565_000969 [Actinoplanes lutulentus]|uniref:DUF4129 domain-containing protein n=1 Tax=Actinoplanes lutulentus TaxID=1287878 RepID=A0A327ZAQ4_9ACTN|nr:hypothetical protein [Actinoplanes lutulentus]MBB2941265.1 hypothetical protein [Actinoplanes lutulentus]RAK36757.1 hypothetical protein B0I29_10719 [Actinoplanes lutulentus]
MGSRSGRAALALVAALSLAVAGCGGTEDGGGVALPTALPSIDLPERTVTPEVTRTAQEEQTQEEQTEEPEETRTTETQKTEEPEETTEPTRTRNTGGAVPTATTVTRTQEATATETPAATTAAPVEETQSAAATVPVSGTDDAGGFWPWLLLFLLIGGVIAIVVINRSRRVSVWDAEGGALAAETRGVVGVRLPPVLTIRSAAERGLYWPPVRDDLRDLSARWGLSAQDAPDGERQASASQIAVLLRDLVPSIDAENEALATGREWQELRPRVNAILDRLSAMLDPPPPPPPPRQAPTEPYYA